MIFEGLKISRVKLQLRKLLPLLHKLPIRKLPIRKLLLLKEHVSE